MPAGTYGPLHGLRVALTREGPDNAALQTALEAEGAAVSQCPLVRVELVSPEKVQLRSNQYAWLAATSRRALAWVDWRLGFANPPFIERCACVGGATAEYARRVLQMEPLVPAIQDAQHLADEMDRSTPLDGMRVLYPRGNLARESLTRLLRECGAQVDDPVVYETMPDPAGLKNLAALIAGGALDAAVFASRSAVQFAREAGAKLEALRCYAIGPTTADALREAGLRVPGQAATPGDEGLLAAIRAGEGR